MSGFSSLHKPGWVVLSLSMGRHLIDISGQRFGRITAIRVVDTHGNWECKCDCGKAKVICGGSLRKGDTVSCGCYQAEVAAITAAKHRRVHGYEGTPIYKIWGHMKQRCSNPNAENYPHYGGRGIAVCERWLKFENFLADMGERPSIGHSLDRVDRDGDYTPENCRWATWSEQNNNHSRNRILEYQETKMTMAQWASALSVNYSSLAYHVGTKGRSLSEALLYMRKQ